MIPLKKIRKSPNKSVRAEPFDSAQDRPVEAQAAPVPGFDKFDPNGKVLDRHFSTAVTSIISPASPEISRFDGYAKKVAG
ncbi:hypothetical protein [Georgfuchsia toluolica]|uniref:hypothetical protein n=1 Tax=Georgfuchsia toluolica TaxID=424218 RepID=UPI001C731DB3|nr:hypothetical protein [Georgfuchsia toluolica]